MIIVCCDISRRAPLTHSHCLAGKQQDAWPLQRLPMLQQALSQRLVALQLYQMVDNDEWASICGLTALTGLRMCTSQSASAQVKA